MKLLNFNNLEFKWEYEKAVRFYAYFIDFKYKFKYWFGYPKFLYFEIDPDINWIKKNYRDYFTSPFKRMKKEVKNETS